jgi:broad specificity phosphatase PhoE
MLDNALNDIGMIQSRSLGKALEDIPFTHVFCSPQKRAVHVILSIEGFSKMQTCEVIMRCHRIPMPGCICDYDIQECNRGQLEGLPKKEVKDFARRCGISFATFGSYFGQEVRDSWLSLLTSSQMHRL